MKAILILCLLFVSLNCSFSDVSKCILTNEKTISIVAELITSIKEKDWNKTAFIYYSNFDAVKSIVNKCLEQDAEKEKEEEKRKEREEKCLEECKDLVDYHEREECFKDCYFRY